MGIAANITELIGGTPIVHLQKLSPPGTEIYGKLESFNPCSSVKDRIALAMISRAEKEGMVESETVIIEPTSGNTGIGLAFVCAQRGYRLILAMPESMSIERRKLLKRLGAELELTASEKGMRGAVEKAEELSRDFPKSFIPSQFDNPANPEIHRKTTAEEIWVDMNGKVDVFVSGVGTGGTISGVGAFLKEKRNEIKIVAIEPDRSAVISGGTPGPHRIQGIGAGFIPDNLDVSIIDETVRVPDNAAFEMSEKLAQEEGILAGISSGANVWAAVELAKRPEMQGMKIVTIICDTGERYLSIWEE